MLKGSGPAEIIILIGMILAIPVMFYDVTPFWYEAQINEAVLHRDIYIMDLSLGAAKSYMDTALSYSVYQACHDILRKDVPEMESKFTTSLEGLTKDYLNRYGMDDYYFMTNYAVTIPEYTSVIIDDVDPIEIRAGSDLDYFIDLEYEGSVRRLEAGSEMQKSIPIYCYGLYEKGMKIKRDTGSRIGSVIVDKTSSWQSTSSTKPDENEREEEIRNINGLTFDWQTEGDYSFKSEFDGVDVSITYTENKATGKFENIEYKLDLNLTITVRDNRNKQAFPIYDGEKITFSPLTMVFLLEVDEDGSVKMIDR